MWGGKSSFTHEDRGRQRERERERKKDGGVKEESHCQASHTECWGEGGRPDLLLSSLLLFFCFIFPLLITTLTLWRRISSVAPGACLSRTRACASRRRQRGSWLESASRVREREGLGSQILSSVGEKSAENACAKAIMLSSAFHPLSFAVSLPLSRAIHYSQTQCTVAASEGTSLGSFLLLLMHPSLFASLLLLALLLLSHSLQPPPTPQQQQQPLPPPPAVLFTKAGEVISVSRSE